MRKRFHSLKHFLKYFFDDSKKLEKMLHHHQIVQPAMMGDVIHESHSTTCHDGRCDTRKFEITCFTFIVSTKKGVIKKTLGKISLFTY